VNKGASMFVNCSQAIFQFSKSTTTQSSNDIFLLIMQIMLPTSSILCISLQLLVLSLQCSSYWLNLATWWY